MAQPRQLVRPATILTMCFLLFHRTSSALPPTPAGTLCVPRERDALLDFKAGLTNPSNSLSLWRGAECCQWWGVVCSNRTGHVVSLQIKGDYLGGEIRSSLLTLRHLKQLDLSYNDFGGKPIPELIGALGRLTHLDLSNSNFSGRIPPHLGNLSNLVSLQLNGMGSYSPDLAWVSRLSKLQVLGMSEVDLSAAVHWSHAINMLPHLIDLELSSCGLRNSMPPPVHSNLTSLETLNLESNSFNTSLGSKNFVWDLPSLQELSLYDCGIDGPIPDAVGNLTSIRTLYLDSNKFTGMVPLTFKKLKNLQLLGLNSNFINMDVAELLHRLPSDELQQLHLPENNLTGSLPVRLGHFSSLTVINLDDNELSGEIPVGIRKLINLNILSLAHNNLHGTITEDHFTNLTSLQYLDLSDNSLTVKVNSTWNAPFSLALASFRSCILGPQFPAWLNQPYIKYLDVSNTSIHDNIPVWIANSPAEYLDLSRNRLVGMLPTFILSSPLEILLVGSNQIVGPIPTLPNNLLYFDLSGNNVSGALPSDIGAPMLQVLFLFKNSFSGTIPCSLLQLRQLEFLDISKNLLNGTFPNCPQGSNLLNGSNQVVGPIPTLPNNLLYFDLSGNNISGALPSDIGAPMLQVLFLFKNSFSGTIPCSLLQLRQLEFLDISKNLLNGTFPNCPQGFKTSNITKLNLNSNSLSGAFPLFLQRCRELKFLNLAYNKFSGSLPTWIGSKLPQLVVLSLRSNMFSGGIPSQVTRMKGLQFLDIACNNISGTIPQSLGNLIAMTFTSNNSGGLFDPINFEYVTKKTFEYFIKTNCEYVTKFMPVDAYTVLVDIKGQLLEYTKGIAYVVNIDFSCNSLTGQIPQEISKLVALKNLNFSWNSLTGTIPHGIGELHALESFDLSHNELSGEIPTSLSALTSLSRLNLSYNNLTGTIPSGNQLRALDDQVSIYIGNPDLCGPPLPKNCSRTDIILYASEEHDEGMSDVVSLYLSMCIGFVVGLWIVFCGFLFKRKWRVGWFSFTDHMYDRAYMHVAVGWASLARKIHQG